jgi:hypothetical protein
MAFASILRFAKNRPRFATILSKMRQFFPVALKDGIRLSAILQALQVTLQFGRAPRRERIDHPVSVPRRDHQSPSPEIGEVLRNLHLRLAQDVLKVANAEGRRAQEMENS